MKRWKLGIGFTLIEMLVVITIIGILIGMIVPVIGRTKEYAWSARCVGNLKELHAAAMNYSFRSDDSYLSMRNLPYSRSWETYDEANDSWDYGVGWVDWTDYVRHSARPNRPGQGWTIWWGPKGYQSITSTDTGNHDSHTLWEHTGKNLKIYSCPTFCRSVIAGSMSPNCTKYGGSTRLSFDLVPGKGVQRSYAMNSKCNGQTVGDGRVSSRMLLFADMSETNRFTDSDTKVTATISVYDMTDSQKDNNYMFGCNWDGELSGITNGTYSIESIGAYHNGKGNAVFVDGHVESLSCTNTVRVCNGM